MSFRPAQFTPIYRAGPPTTENGLEWTMRISAQPPDEWLVLFQGDAGAPASARDGCWAVNVQPVELRFKSSPADVPQAIERIDERIRRANDQYGRWLDDTHRKGDARRHDELTEADRIRDLNARFKNL